jgi:glutamate racemase
MTTTSDLPIGVFDSGVGGLTVMRALVDRLPDEHVTYLGDTARVPYGNRAADTVRQYAENATSLLVDRGIKALVVACNTASAYALPTLVESLDVPVIGVIDPVAERAASETQTDQIGVLGTRGTVRSECYPEAIRQYCPAAEVYQAACPLLVPLAEEGWLEGGVVDEVGRHYLTELQGYQIDTLILGCTHYPILRPALQKLADELLDGEVRLLDSAETTAEVTARMLDEHDRRAEHNSPDLDFLFTDVSPAFVDMAQRFFGNRLDQLTHVDITGAGSGG